MASVEESLLASVEGSLVVSVADSLVLSVEDSLVISVSDSIVVSVEESVELLVVDSTKLSVDGSLENSVVASSEDDSLSLADWPVTAEVLSLSEVWPTDELNNDSVVLAPSLLDSLVTSVEDPSDSVEEPTESVLALETIAAVEDPPAELPLEGLLSVTSLEIETPKDDSSEADVEDSVDDGSSLDLSVTPDAEEVNASVIHLGAMGDVAPDTPSSSSSSLSSSQSSSSSSGRISCEATTGVTSSSTHEWALHPSLENGTLLPSQLLMEVVSLFIRHITRRVISPPPQGLVHGLHGPVNQSPVHTSKPVQFCSDSYFSSGSHFDSSTFFTISSS